MKKNGVKNVVKNYKNGAKTRMVLNDIFVKIANKQILEKDQKYLKQIIKRFSKIGYLENTPKKKYQKNTT